jgi:hypothetical protein
MIEAAIILLYSGMMALDYLSQEFQFKKYFQNKNIGNSFVVKNKFALVSRGFSFLIAPILGYLLAYSSFEEMYKLFLICISTATFIQILLLCIFFYRCMPFFNKEVFLIYLKKNILVYFLGSLAFAVYLNSPFILNIISTLYINQALWIVQIAPLVTAVVTLYLVFIFDPMIARELDRGTLTISNSLYFLSQRVIGRFIITLCLIASVFIF